MLETVKIENFRRINSLELSGLQAINIFLGGRDSLKTSILEAIYILTNNANPEALLHLNSLRGFKNNVKDLQYLFPAGDYTKEIDITSGKISVNIANISIDEIKRVAMDKDISSSTIFLADALPFYGIDITYPEYSYSLHIDGILETETHVNGLVERPTNSIFIGSNILSVNTKMIDKIILENKLDTLITKFQFYDFGNNLKNLALDMNGRLYVDFVHNDKMIPLHCQGDNFKRFLIIYSCLEHAKDGYLFIDNLEMCFHYSQLAGVWRYILNKAQEYNIQLFISTQSLECLKAIDIAKAKSIGVSAYRVDLKIDDDCGHTFVPKVYSNDTFEHVLANNFEIR